jgi:type I restriction enzyme S subunit
MKYKRYPKYKDSGVEWLGEIPEEWTCLPLFPILPEHYEQNIGMQSEVVLSLSYGKIVKKDISDNFGLLPESFETYQLVKPDDIILRLTDLQNDQRSLRTAISSHSGIITSAYLKLRCTQNPAFFHWLLYSADTQKVFYGLGGGVRQSMKFSDLKRFPIVVPPLSTQHSIAAFLDTETARIDGLIKDYEELIELLKEKRQALISHAVTRGLSELVNPDDPEFGEWAKPVKFKDSGVEWIGEIPVGWDCLAIKHCCTLIKDGTHLPPARVENGVPLLSVRNLQESKFSFLEDDSLISTEDYAKLCKSFVPKSGDVLLAIVGATLGKTAIVPQGMDDFHIQRSLAIFRPAEFTKAQFIHFWMASLHFQGELWNNVGFSAQPGIYLGTLCQFRIAIPSAKEQQAISSFLEIETSKIDTLVSESESAIELLKEHRSALITNAVTGKINVENIA